MPELSVLMPYKPDNGHRDEVFHWVSVFYRKYLPFAEICIGYSKSTLFSRAQAINDAAQKAQTDLFLIADTDIFYDPGIIIEARAMLRSHAWIIPFNKVLDIQQACTQHLLRNEPEWPLVMPVQGNIRAYGSKGGLTLIPREHFEAVNGLDERFIGWGGEDDAFACSMDTLCGKHYRMNKAINHLWHPSLKKNGNPNYSNNYSLYLKYSQATGNIAAMRDLISQRMPS